MKRSETSVKISNVNHYITILQSYLAGEELEHRLKGSNDDWTPCKDPVFDFNHLEYRVKPKPAYRPYISGDEAFANMQDHSPFGWLFNTITMCYEHINCIGINGINTYNKNYSYKEAFNVFVYPNETKFGIKLDEEA